MSTGRWNRVVELFGEALERLPQDQDGWLRDHCRGDAELHAEVQSLLQASASAETYFDQLGEMVRSLPEEELGEAARAGDRLGPYEIEVELGRGGMGVVYRAHDVRLDRRVAIKVLPPWLSGDPAARERLIGEARAASVIDHPNIGVLHDVVETEDGAVALVLGHYEGETLRTRLARGPIDSQRTLEIARDIATGLAAAHQRNIVHRDIKPSNVLLTADGRVKILDFGVATVLGAEDDPSGRRAGTIAYMSPAQIRGRPPDPQVDLWALGVLIFEMVAGERPFSGPDREAVRRAILEDDPPDLGDRRTAGVVRRLLARSRDDGFEDASAAAAALDRLIAIDRPGPRARLQPWPRAVAGVVGAILAAFVLATVAWPGFRGASGGPERATQPGSLHQDRVAILPFVVRGSDDVTYLREGLADLLSASLHGAGALRTVDPAALFVRTDPATRLDPAAAQRLAAGFGAGQFVLGDVVEAGGRIRVGVALYDDARGPEAVARVQAEGPLERLFEIVDDVATQLILAERGDGVGRLTRVASVTTTSLPAFKRYLAGERAVREGRFSEAMGAFQQAVAIDSTYALAFYGLSVAAGWGYRTALADSAAGRAAALSNRLPSIERRLAEAALAWPTGELERAERLYLEVLEEQPAAMEAWFNLGELYFHMNALRGRSMAEAREPFERALDLAGYDHYESLVHLADLAARERDIGRYDSLYRRLDPDAELAPIYTAQHGLITGDDRVRAETLRLLREGDPNRARVVAGRLAGFTVHVPEAAAAARTLIHSEVPSDWRAVGQLRVALYEAGLGRSEAVRRALNEAAPLAPLSTLLHRAYLLSLPVTVAGPAEVEETRRSLNRWIGGSAAPEGADRLHTAQHRSLPVLVPYLSGALAARMEDTTAVGRAILSLDALAAESQADPLAAELADELRARLTPDPADRIRLLLGPEDGFGRPYALVSRSPFHARTAGRWLLADALERAGRLEEAAGWYRSFLGPFVYDVPLHGAARERLAHIRATPAVRTAEPPTG